MSITQGRPQDRWTEQPPPEPREALPPPVAMESAEPDAGPTGPLTAAETESLKTAEDVIERGRVAYNLVAAAILHIRDRRLYRGQYKTFEDYMQVRWNFTRQRGYQLLAAASVAANLSTSVDIQPETEFQLRPLARLAPEQQPVAWSKAVAENGGAQPTAAQVRTAAAEVAPPPLLRGSSVWWREEPSGHVRTGTAKGEYAGGYTIEPNDGGSPPLVAIMRDRLHLGAPPSPPTPYGKCLCCAPLRSLDGGYCPECRGGRSARPSWAPWAEKLKLAADVLDRLEVVDPALRSYQRAFWEEAQDACRRQVSDPAATARFLDWILAAAGGEES